MKIVGVIFWIIGILLLCVGGVLLVSGKSDENNILQNYAQANAVVTGNECRVGLINNNPNLQYKYCWEFEFKTKDGQTISFNKQNAAYRIGQQVPVYYDPHDPAHTVEIAADVKNDYLAILGGIILVFAILSLVVGTAFFVAGLVRGRRASANKLT